jgi:hypothetical protein
MNKLKLYLIDYPKDYVLDICHRIKMWRLNKFRKHIYDYEIGCCLNDNIRDTYYGTVISDMKIGVFSPVLVATKTLEQYFGFEGYHRLGIHGIDVDTQKRDEKTLLVEQIDVTIRLNRPGLLIGKAGNDIYAVEKLLSENFGKQTKIHIVEVKGDINRPSSYY